MNNLCCFCVYKTLISKIFAVEKSAKIKKWTSQEANGLIFVWYHAENEDPWELPIVNEIDKGDWIFHGKNEFIVNSHIQDIPENGADVGKCLFILIMHRQRKASTAVSVEYVRFQLIPHLVH